MTDQPSPQNHESNWPANNAEMQRIRETPAYKARKSRLSAEMRIVVAEMNNGENKPAVGLPDEP